MAIGRSKITNIWIEAVDTNPSDLATTDAISGEIKAYNKSGGANEVESDPVFGGFGDKEKTREQKTKNNNILYFIMEKKPKILCNNNSSCCHYTHWWRKRIWSWMGIWLYFTKMDN